MTFSTKYSPPRKITIRIICQALKKINNRLNLLGNSCGTDSKA